MMSKDTLSPLAKIVLCTFDMLQVTIHYIKEDYIIT